VEDNGPGIPAEYRSMIFQKFSRAPGSGSGGTGLGLSIAKGFVEALNGTLTFQDRPGGGSRFVITLPVDAAPASGEPA
jgi:two-component system sensor histidine kinase KdpD